MYKLEYLPSAIRDMTDAVSYVSGQLHNSQAAEVLMNAFLDAAQQIPSFPYSNPLYRPLRPLKQEYRKMVVGNYLVFYWVGESKQTVTVARVIYGRMKKPKLNAATATLLLMEEIRKGLDSAERSGWVSEEDADMQIEEGAMHD